MFEKPTKKTATMAVSGPKIERLDDVASVAADVAAREQAVRDKAHELGKRRTAPIDPVLDWLEAERATYRRASLRLLRLQDSYRIEVELPGIAKQDVEIRVAAGKVVIRAQRSLGEHGGVAIVDELGVAEIWRDLQLPPDCDAHSVIARMSDGILELTMKRHAAPVEPEAEIVAASAEPKAKVAARSAAAEIKRAPAKRSKKN